MQRIGKGDDGQAGGGGEEGDHGRAAEQKAVGRAGNEVFFEQQLDGVGEGLQHAVRADAHGAEADLHIGQNLALEQYGVGHGQRDDGDDDEGQGQGQEPGVGKNGLHEVASQRVMLHWAKRTQGSGYTPMTSVSTPVTPSATFRPRLEETGSACS